MFLDTNGDGLSSAADVIQPSGTTTLDLWLRTNADRSGNTVTCNTGDGEPPSTATSSFSTPRTAR